MPTADQHRNKAEKNRKFLATISLTDHPEWVVTVAFYVAVHTIERLRAFADRSHSDSHYDRMRCVQIQHAEIHYEYQILETASRIARYDSSADFFVKYDATRIQTQLIDKALATIENYANRVLGISPSVRS